MFNVMFLKMRNVFLVSTKNTQRERQVLYLKKSKKKEAIKDYDASRQGHYIRQSSSRFFQGYRLFRALGPSAATRCTPESAA
jgi:hypothetical protein